MATSMAQLPNVNTSPMGNQPTAKVLSTSPLAQTLPGGRQVGAPNIPGIGVQAPTGPVANSPLTINAPTLPTTGLSTQGGDYTLVGDFQDTYGKGTGTALASTLANLGTSTDQAIQTTNAAVLQAAGKQYADIQANEAAHGVSSDSSTAALAAGDFASTVNTQLQATDARMALSEEDTLIQSLFQEGTKHGHDSSWTDSLGDIFSGISSAAGAISQGFGIGGTAGSILDVIAGL